MSPRHRNHRSWDSGAEGRDPPEMCPTSGKRKYASEAEAKVTAQHQMSQKSSSALRLRTYRCIYCDSWHLTSKSD